MRSIIIVPMLAAYLSGCTHLYDEARHNAAKDIQSAFAEADPAQAIENQSQRIANLAETERDAVGGNAEYLRDRLIWQVATGRSTSTPDLTDEIFNGRGGSSANLGEQIGFAFNEDMSITTVGYSGVRLGDIGVETTADFVSLIEFQTNLELASQVAQDNNLMKRAVRALWADVPTCNKARTMSEADAVAQSKVQESDVNRFLARFERYKEACTPTPSLSKLGINVGLIGDALERYQAASAQVAGFESAKRATRKEIRDNTPPKSSDRDSFVSSAQEIAEDIGNVVSRFSQASEKLGVESELAEQRLSQLSILLSAVNNASVDGLSDDEVTNFLDGDENEDFRKAVILAVGLPGLGESVEGVFDLIQRPNARSDLLLQMEILRARLNYLRTREKLAREKKALAAAYVESLAQEALYLRRANRLLIDSGLRKQTFTAILDDRQARSQNLDSRSRQKAYQAIIAFEQSISLHRRNGEMLRTDLINFGDRERLAADEYTMNTWQAFLSGPIDQLVAFHGAGVKQQPIVDAINGLLSLGLLGFAATD